MHTENKSKTGRVVFVGESGFPVGLATIQRMTLMARAFLHVGCQTTVVCRKGVQPQNQGIDFPKKGNFEGVDYVYTSNSIYKSNSFLQRNREKLMGMLGEFKFLKKHKEQEGLWISDGVPLFRRTAYHTAPIGITPHQVNSYNSTPFVTGTTNVDDCNESKY